MPSDDAQAQKRANGNGQMEMGNWEWAIRNGGADAGYQVTTRAFYVFHTLRLGSRPPWLTGRRYDCHAIAAYEVLKYSIESPAEANQRNIDRQCGSNIGLPEMRR